MNMISIHAESVKSMLQQIKRTSLGCSRELCVMEGISDKIRTTKSKICATMLGLKLQNMVTTHSGYKAGLHSFSWSVICHHLNQIVGEENV
jgi:hypothetical protein